MTLSKLLAGWSFRTNKPTYDAGDELTAFVTGYEDGEARVRIGDTIITLPDAEPGLVDRRVRLRVTEFDTETAVGQGEVLEIVDPAA
ncbi:DUF7513 family protein [Haloplanus halobius]|uniref:DUF7513 family protein n=1 Tax=Haloplanus halobius TaxID=2934938 RepID=UPI00200BEAD4|nr:hypothetical protein [Haloplanus sp. XH21]